MQSQSLDTITDDWYATAGGFVPVDNEDTEEVVSSSSRNALNSGRPACLAKTCAAMAEKNATDSENHVEKSMEVEKNCRFFEALSSQHEANASQSSVESQSNAEDSKRLAQEAQRHPANSEHHFNVCSWMLIFPPVDYFFTQSYLYKINYCYYEGRRVHDSWRISSSETVCPSRQMLRFHTFCCTVNVICSSIYIREDWK